MIYRRTAHFKHAYRALSEEAQAKTREALALFQNDLHHPLLDVKLIDGVEGIWEGRISEDIRFTFHFATEPQTWEAICVLRRLGCITD